MYDEKVALRARDESGGEEEAVTWKASSFICAESDAEDAARECVAHLEATAEGPLRGVLVYFTLLHDPEEIVEAFASALGDVPFVGASVQGVASAGVLGEDGYLCGVMGWSGDIAVDVHRVTDVSEATTSKGAELGAFAKSVEGGPGQLGVLLYDPLTGANARELLEGFDAACPGMALLGGAAAAPWGPLVETWQLYRGEALRDAAVMMVLKGDFELVHATSTGTIPTGQPMTVTASMGPVLQSLDDKPAFRVWREALGLPETVMLEETASWALGVECGHGSSDWTVLAPFNYDAEQEAIGFAVDVPEGTAVRLHKRSPEVILDRTRAMANALREVVGERSVAAMLTFECGGRTTPFLGIDATREEHELVQSALASEGTPWLGGILWGEIAPVGRGNEFFNYTYPIALMCRPSSPAKGSCDGVDG